MPELPEVETVRRDLEKYLIGASFQSIKIINFKNVAPRATFLAKFLKGKKIVALGRRGKLLIVDLSAPDKHLLFHLKMTGQLIYEQSNKTLAGGHSLSDDSLTKAVGGKLPNKYTRAIFDLDKNRHLYFNDIRKFGYIKLVSNDELRDILKNNYGPEPMDKEFSFDYLKELCQKRSAPIKAVILNQKLIAGLGNIYADEALFAAKIRPDRPAKSLKRSELLDLHNLIIIIIKQAIKARGTTFRNYVDARGKKGNFVNYLQVYQRQGQTCLVCGGIISKIKVAGRGTHYCPHCQK
ncbi:MAG: bifunctional DNA-formamidopyrimidine glycosylase/DNA-(apurinic or apyrimidinic site) lyase [Patescibacteria group bacterium]|nr:bifunctional DNA-formamidopyrimidine glycosylase/DNA-(apurinic or apyrimidinic site) lyase [Patescibacteria group bacterium]